MRREEAVVVDRGVVADVVPAPEDDVVADSDLGWITFASKTKQLSPISRSSAGIALELT